jgi:hypothetical protein
LPEFQEQIRREIFKGTIRVLPGSDGRVRVIAQATPALSLTRIATSSESTATPEPSAPADTEVVAEEPVALRRSVAPEPKLRVARLARAKVH